MINSASDANDTLLSGTHSKKRGTSLRDQAYEAIKHMILTGKLEPGEYINEADLALQLQIGRTPVNQAMQRLGLENLVVTMPRKGVYVKPLGLNELRLIVETRRVNECFAAERAAQNANSSDVDAMRQYIANGRDAMDAADTFAFLEADRHFHTALSVAAGNTILASILDRLHEQAQRYWYLSLQNDEHMPVVQAEHEAIFAAIEAKNPAAAKRAMAAHIDSLQLNLTGRI